MSDKRKDGLNHCHNYPDCNRPGTSSFHEKDDTWTRWCNECLGKYFESMASTAPLRAAVERVLGEMADFDSFHTSNDNKVKVWCDALSKALAVPGDVGAKPHWECDNCNHTVCEADRLRICKRCVRILVEEGTIAAADVAALRDEVTRKPETVVDRAWINTKLQALIIGAGLEEPGMFICAECAKRHTIGEPLTAAGEPAPQEVTVPLAVVDKLREYCVEFGDKAHERRDFSRRDAYGTIKSDIDWLTRSYRPAPAPSTDGPEPCATCHGLDTRDMDIRCPDCQPPVDKAVADLDDAIADNEAGRKLRAEMFLGPEPTPPTTAERAGWWRATTDYRGATMSLTKALKGDDDDKVIAWRDGRKGDV